MNPWLAAHQGRSGETKAKGSIGRGEGPFFPLDDSQSHDGSNGDVSTTYKVNAYPSKAPTVPSKVDEDGIQKEMTMSVTYEEASTQEISSSDSPWQRLDAQRPGSE